MKSIAGYYANFQIAGKHYKAIIGRTKSQWQAILMPCKSLIGNGRTRIEATQNLASKIESKNIGMEI